MNSQSRIIRIGVGFIAGLVLAAVFPATLAVAEVPEPAKVRVSVAIENVTGNFEFEGLEEENLQSLIESELVGRGFVVVNENSYDENIERQDTSSGRFNPRGRIPKARLLAPAQVLRVDISVNYADRGEVIGGQIEVPGTADIGDITVGTQDGGHVVVLISGKVESTESSTYAMKQVFAGRAKVGIPDNGLFGIPIKIGNGDLAFGRARFCNEACQEEYGRQAFNLALGEFMSKVEKGLRKSPSDTTDLSAPSGKILKLDRNMTATISLGAQDGVYEGDKVYILGEKLENNDREIVAVGKVMLVRERTSMIEVVNQFGGTIGCGQPVELKTE